MCDDLKHGTAMTADGTGWLAGRPGRLVWLAHVGGRTETDRLRSIKANGCCALFVS